MKYIEDEYKNIKNDYGDKISAVVRTKMQRYFIVIKQAVRLQVLKGEQKSFQEQIKNQLYRIRRDIQGQIKLQLSDYEAFIWKLQKLQHKPVPEIFSLMTSITIPSETNIQNVKKNTNFQVLGLKTKQMIKISVQLLLQNEFCSENYSSQIMTKLLTHISYNYNIQPYHNFSHAFSVFIMLIQASSICPNISKIFSQFQLFVCFISALCHDLNHNGTNSQFQIKKKSEISLIYNNQSVLENMHIYQFYRICKQNPDIDIFSKLKSPIQREKGKRTLTRLILATDMSVHSQKLDKLKKISNKDIMQLDSTERQLLLESLFHACDIGNPCLDFETYLNWSLLLSYEFSKQVSLEKQENLQPSPNFEFVDICTHYQRQIGFIDYVVFPFWKELSSIFSQFQFLSQNIENNKKKLQKLIRELK